MIQYSRDTLPNLSQCNPTAPIQIEYVESVLLNLSISPHPLFLLFYHIMSFWNYSNNLLNTKKIMGTLALPVHMVMEHEFMSLSLNIC